MSPIEAVIYWHRDLPPVTAEMMGEHTVDPDSIRVQGTLTHGHELWTQCYADLMAQTHRRIVQEIGRLGGRYAHIVDESIGSRRDDAHGQAWLHGRFDYVLYR